MQDLEKMRQWLQTFPGWGESILTTDHTDGVPGSVGIYPNGREILSQQEDVLGNVRLNLRSTFLLRRIGACPHENEENARWLLDLQDWICSQSAMGLAPVFGDAPRQERIRAEQGRREGPSSAGTGVYTVTVTVEYMKQYDFGGNDHENCT